MPRRARAPARRPGRAPPSDARRLAMQGVNAQDAGVDRRVGARDDPLAVQDRQDVVAPAPLRGRDVDLEAMVEPEQLGGARAVAQQVVKRRQDRRTRAGPQGAGGVDVPRRGVPRVAEPGDRDALQAPRSDERGEGVRQVAVAPAQEVRADVRGPGHTEHSHGAQHRRALRLLVGQLGERSVRGQAALEDIPQPLATAAPADADAPLEPQQVQQPRDRLAAGDLVGPPAVAPRLGRAILELAGAQRAAGAQFVRRARRRTPRSPRGTPARAAPARPCRRARSASPSGAAAGRRSRRATPRAPMRRTARAARRRLAAASPRAPVPAARTARAAGCARPRSRDRAAGSRSAARCPRSPPAPDGRAAARPRGPARAGPGGAPREPTAT